jgi:lipoate-protein ligase A
MAIDEALLHSAQQGTASLRFYGWSEPTLSLGYFQPTEARRADPLLASLPYVRRPTGGATLVHHHELTYALALPEGTLWLGHASWLGRMHAVIVRCLKRWQIGARLKESQAPVRHTGMLCFNHHSPGDLLIGGSKVVGSAQWKRRGALLQHGAILLAQSAFTPALPGIQELTRRTLDGAEVAHAIAEELARETEWQLSRAALTDPERKQAENLVATRYTQAGWNDKR